jgi:hypothetical protein
MFSACSFRLRVIHGFFDGENIVLRYTPFYDFSREDDEEQRNMLLLVRHLVGHAVGDATKLHKPLKLPGPMPVLEKDWKREAKAYNNALKAKKKKKMAERKLKEEQKQRKSLEANGDVRGGTVVEVTKAANGSCNGVPKSNDPKKLVMLNGSASVLKRAG